MVLNGASPIQPRKSMVMSSSLAIPILVCSGTEPTSVKEGFSLRIKSETQHNSVSSFFAKLNKSYVIAQFSFLLKEYFISVSGKKSKLHSPEFFAVVACVAIEMNIIRYFPRAIWRMYAEVIQYERIPDVLEEQMFRMSSQTQQPLLHDRIHGIFKFGFGIDEGVPLTRGKISVKR